MSTARVSRRLALTGMLVVLVVLLAGLPALGAKPSAAGRTAGPQAVRDWLGWTSLGKPADVGIISYPVVGQNQDGRLEVFVGGSDTPSTDYTVYHIWQTGSGWSNWDRLGTREALAAPSVAQNTDGRLEVFAQQLWYEWGGGAHYDATHIYQTAANGPWGSWSDLGQPSNGNVVDLWEPYAGRNQDGRLAIFAKGQGGDGNVWTKSQTGAGTTTWSGWSSLSKPGGVSLSAVLSVGQQQDGSLDIFTYGFNYEVYHNWQTAPNGASWNGWVSFGKPPGVDVHMPAASRNQDGWQEFFTSGSDGQLWHKWQVAPNDGWAWSGWGSLGNPPGVNLGNPIVGRYANGAMKVLTRGSDSAIWSIAQTAPSNGWGMWESVGKPLGVNLTDQMAVARTWTGYLALFVVGEDGALWMNQEGWVIVPCYGLAVDVQPGGGGSVDLDPPRNCQQGTAYLEGTAVKLTAVANGGYSFDAWSGDATGKVNPVTITMDGNKSVTANFAGTGDKSWFFLPIVVK